MTSVARTVPGELDAAVRRLVARYSHLVDDGDFQAAGALFTEDARLVAFGEEISGRDGIVGWLQAVPRPCLHLVSNTVVSAGSKPDTAHDVSDFAFSTQADGAWTTVLVGRYHDTLVGPAEDLHFSQRLITAR